MNLLIAIMSDSYERVMDNLIPADCRQLASMLLETEELVNLLKFKINGEQIQNEYKYIIYSQRLGSSESSNSWEGIVGELKNVIKKEVNKIQVN